MLEHIIYKLMPEQCPLYDSAVKEFIITEHVAGGKVEVERLRKKAAEGHEFSGVIVDFYDKWEKVVLDILDYWNFRLWVHKDHRAYSKRQDSIQSSDYQTSRVSNRINDQKLMKQKYDHLKEENPDWSDARIKDSIALAFGKPYVDEKTGMQKIRPISRETVNRAVHRPADSHERCRKNREGAA